MELTKGTTYKRYTASGSNVRTHIGKVTEAEPHAAFVEAVEVYEMYNAVSVSDVVLNRDVENIVPLDPEAYESSVADALTKSRTALEEAEERVKRHRDLVAKLEHLNTVGARA